MKQLIAHLIGDYILQSHWMANEKTSKSFACLCHVILYGVPFYIIGASWTALLVIVSTHFFIDRFRLARYVIYAKNFLAPLSSFYRYPSADDGVFGDGRNIKNIFDEQFSWSNCKSTGYPSETPPFLAVWLLIIVDNTLHLAINYLALSFL